MTNDAKKLGTGHYEFMGYEIVHGYAESGEKAWLVLVDTGTLANRSLTEAKECVLAMIG